MLNCRTTFVSVQRGILVCGTTMGFDDDFGCGGQRSDVTKFSIESRRRLLFFLRNAVAEHTSFVTLTYPPGYGSDGITAKRDLKLFLERLRRLQCVGSDSDGRETGSNGKLWSVLWFQEWQRNGRLHYHVCCSHYVNRQWLSKCWFDVVGSGNQKHLAAGTNVRPMFGGREGMCRYAAKYCAKKEQKIAPEGYTHPGRFWGVWGCRQTVAASTAWSFRHCSDYRIKEAVDLLNSVVKGAIAQGELKKVDQRRVIPGVTVFNLPDGKLRDEIMIVVTIIDSRLREPLLPECVFNEYRRERKFDARISAMDTDVPRETSVGLNQ